MATYYPRVKANLAVVFDGFGAPDKPQILPDITPASFNVHLNSYKEADTWEITFDSLDFPFSPELIRTASVEIYAYEAPDAVTPVQWQKAENLLVTGLVDESQLSQAGKGTVTLSGRDYTALLLDRKWNPTKSGQNGRVPAGLPLEEVVQKLVDEAVQAGRIGTTLKVRVIDVPVDPVTGRVAKGITQKHVTTPKTATGRSTKKKKGTFVKADQSYWDTIYKLCLSYGYIVFVKGFEVIITQPHVLQATSAENAYRVAYGQNLSSLVAERKMSKESVPQVRVRSYSATQRRNIEGRYPERGDAQAATATNLEGEKFLGFRQTGNTAGTEEYVTMTVKDVDDEATLKKIARTAYFTKSRGEGSVHFHTKHLRDLESKTRASKSLLQLRPGDPVVIQWDAFNSQVMTDGKLTAAQRASYLTGLGYSQAVAGLVAQNYDRLDFFRQPFYTKEVNVTWDAESGMTFEVSAMNFINVARDGKVV